MPFNTYAYFYVRDFDCDSQHISDTLQLTPSLTWHKNDLGVAGRLRTFSNWELQSPLPRDAPFQDLNLEALLAILNSQRAAVMQVIAQYKCGLQGVGFYTNETPSFHMSRELIASIAAYQLSVDFDLYCGSSVEAADYEQSEADSSSGTHWDGRVVNPEGVLLEYRVAPFADPPLRKASNGIGYEVRDFDPLLTADDHARIAKLTANQLTLID